jgi:YgiT-type zinc finger domain-containing protein
MKCVTCKTGNLTDGMATIMHEKDETMIVFKNVPALVCDQCGESYTDRDVTAKLLQIVKDEAAKGKELELIRYPA